MTLTKIVNGVEIELTPDEIVEYNQIQAEAEANYFHRLKEHFAQEIQIYIDKTSRSKDYENALSCATYINSTNATWKAEADAFITWRDAVWLYAYTELEKFENEERPAVSIEEFIEELPIMEWPND